MYEGGCGEREAGVCRSSSSSRISRIFLTNTLENGFAFVKKVLKKNGNCGLALRKRLFCDAKQPLLPCKTYAFGTQNNRFCKALIARRLCDSCACEKYLQYCGCFELLWWIFGVADEGFYPCNRADEWQVLEIVFVGFGIWKNTTIFLPFFCLIKIFLLFLQNSVVYYRHERRM